MIPGVESRLAIAAVFLTLQVTVFAFELLYFVSTVSESTWYIPLRQWSPTVFTMLGVVLVSIMFASPNISIETTGSQCAAQIDADVAGEGVRIAVWVQVGVLIIISFAGSFHPKATGVKEMGAGLVLTHISLAIALAVQLGRGTLSLADAAAGAMLLDSQNVALSIQLAAKETLAARWQVRVVILAQLFGLVLLPILVSRLFAGSFATDDCSCLTVFWWAWLNSCRPSSREAAIFWTYFTSRCVGFAQAAFHALYNAQAFHLAEPKCGDDGNEEQQKGGLLYGITYPYITEETSVVSDNPAYNVPYYGEYPATVTFIYSWYGVYALTSLAAAEVAMHDLDLKPSSAVDSVGQIIALVIAGATAFRAAWLFYQLFEDEWKAQKHFGFIWPFHRQRYTGSRATYILTPDFSFPPDSIKLGSIITDPHDLRHPLTKQPPDIGHWPPATSFKKNVDLNLSTTGHRWHRWLSAILFAALPTEHSYRRIKIELLEKEQLLEPKEVAQQIISNDEEVKQHLRNSGMKGFRRVYMVTGKMVARGATVVSGEAQEAHAAVEIPLVTLNADTEEVTEQTHLTASDFILAYQLRSITVSGDLEVKGLTRYTRGATL